MWKWAIKIYLSLIARTLCMMLAQQTPTIYATDHIHGDQVSGGWFTL